jgi:hypothetical protein
MGFEPMRPCDLHAFQACQINHSCTPPGSSAAKKVYRRVAGDSRNRVTLGEFLEKTEGVLDFPGNRVAKLVFVEVGVGWWIGQVVGQADRDSGQIGTLFTQIVRDRIRCPEHRAEPKPIGRVEVGYLVVEVDGFAVNLKGTAQNDAGAKRPARHLGNPDYPRIPFRGFFKITEEAEHVFGRCANHTFQANPTSTHDCPLRSRRVQPVGQV